MSLLLHALILLLQFGVPGQGEPGPPAALTVVIAQGDIAVRPAPPASASPGPVLPAPAPPAPVPPVADTRLPPPLAPPRTGMRLVDPVAVSEPTPVLATVKARPKVRKDKPRRAKRISSPLIDKTLDDSVRVIAQDSTLNDFNVPLARPEEADQKSIDPKEAQPGDDDGDAAANAALEAQAAVVAAQKTEDEEKALKLAEQQETTARLAAAERELQASQEQKKLEDARLAQEQLKKQQRDELDLATVQERQVAEQQERQQRAEQQKAEQQRAEQQRAEQQRAEQQRAEQERAEQQRAEQQRAEQLKQEQQRQDVAKAEQQRAEQQRAEQQRVEQQRVEQQRAGQQRAEQQRVEQQRAEQQRAEQQRAEQQRAEQQRAGEEAARDAAERSRNLASAPPGNGGTGGPAAGGREGTTQIPKNMMGSDAATRAREMVRGLDLLRGSPPAPRSRGERRIAVGASERDLPLKMYAESWRQKIERNGTVNYPRSWADVVRIDPLVSVAVRSDGTVEDVTIIVSSGYPEMDEAVRRIVRVNARYSPFPPPIAERYDVIEIRRIWRFDDKLRLFEEVR